MPLKNSDYSILADSELINLLNASDHNAYIEIYERYRYLMFVFAYKKLRDEDLSKDFVQELFTNLWIKRDHISKAGNFAAYLYTTLRNKIIDHFIHKEVESKYIIFLGDFAPSFTRQSADFLVREKQLKAYIDAEIQALPAKMRAVFELSRTAQLSHQEIADKLNISTNNVSKHINGALKILKAKLGTFFTIGAF